MTRGGRCRRDGDADWKVDGPAEYRSAATRGAGTRRATGQGRPAGASSQATQGGKAASSPLGALAGHASWQLQAHSGSLTFPHSPLPGWPLSAALPPPHAGRLPTPNYLVLFFVSRSTCVKGMLRLHHSSLAGCACVRPVSALGPAVRRLLHSIMFSRLPDLGILFGPLPGAVCARFA